MIQAVLKPLKVDFFCTGKKFLVYNLVSRNLKIKYRRSIFGVFWTLLNPIALSVVYYVVFKLILKVRVPHYLVFVLGGVLPWTFFSSSIVEGTESIVLSWMLVSKIPIPIQVLPYAPTITNFVTLLVSIPVIFVAAIVSDSPINAIFLISFFYLACLFLITYSLAFICSIAYVYLRDLKHALNIFMQVWMYGTPIFYDQHMVPEHFRWALYANPVGLLFSDLHHCFSMVQAPPLTNIFVILAWTLAIFLLAVWCHKRFAVGLVEQI